MRANKARARELIDCDAEQYRQALSNQVVGDDAAVILASVER
jgi:hypothetical protein